MVTTADVAYSNGYQAGQRSADLALDFVREYNKARYKFPAMASAHEGYAVIAEEMDELWEIVKQKQSTRDYAAMRKEVVQLGAMLLSFLIEIVDTENRR